MHAVVGQRIRKIYTSIQRFYGTYSFLQYESVKCSKSDVIICISFNITQKQPNKELIYIAYPINLKLKISQSFQITQNILLKTGYNVMVENIPELKHTYIVTYR